MILAMATPSFLCFSLSYRIQANGFLLSILVIAGVFWIHRLIKFIYNICCYWEIHSFYISALKIPMVNCQNLETYRYVCPNSVQVKNGANAQKFMSLITRYWRQITDYYYSQHTAFQAFYRYITGCGWSQNTELAKLLF